MKKVPVTLQLLVLAVALTGVYTMVGQAVPQKEVHPPEVIEIAADVSTEDMVAIGKGIFEGKGICNTCHTIGKSGALRFPDLDGIATTAAGRISGYNALDYLVESMYEPDKYVVDGFNPGMPRIDKPPIGLTDDEILCVIAYLQTLGGEPTVTMETTHAYVGGPGPGEGGVSGGAS
jgi:mono/diheme cytochrome c family protein